MMIISNGEFPNKPFTEQLLSLLFHLDKILHTTIDKRTKERPDHTLIIILVSNYGTKRKLIDTGGNKFFHLSAAYCTLVWCAL